MSKSINALIAEADELILGHYELKTASVKEDDVFKLAEELRASELPAADEDYSMTEKIAHAVAIVDTLINLPELVRVAGFEKKAKESGFTNEQICGLFEKKASVKFKSVLDMIPMAR